MNSAAVKNPDLVKQASMRFGPETVTIVIDAKRSNSMPSGFELVVSGGTKPVGHDAVLWAKQCQEFGAGIILPTSMDGDGTQNGYDLDYTKAISDAIDLPVVEPNQPRPRVKMVFFKGPDDVLFEVVEIKDS